MKKKKKNIMEIINDLLNGHDNVIDKLNQLDYEKNYRNQVIMDKILSVDAFDRYKTGK